MQAVIALNIFNKNGGSIPVCTERKATGLFVLTSFRCDNAVNGKVISPLREGLNFAKIKTFAKISEFTV